jgi:hypothetical protein
MGKSYLSMTILRDAREIHCVAYLHSFLYARKLTFIVDKKERPDPPRADRQGAGKSDSGRHAGESREEG